MVGVAILDDAPVPILYVCRHRAECAPGSPLVASRGITRERENAEKMVNVRKRNPCKVEPVQIAVRSVYLSQITHVVDRLKACISVSIAVSP